MHEIKWQGNKESNLGMLESKSSALTNLAIPLRNRLSCGIPQRRILFTTTAVSADAHQET